MSGAGKGAADGKAVLAGVQMPTASVPQAPMPTPVGIAGIGIDLLRIERIEAALAKRGERFAAKILGPEEMAKFRARSARDPARGVRFLATRFAAKEAFSKAIGLGMRMPMTWRHCEISKLPSGQPVIVLHGELKTWFEAKGLTAHITVTDETDYAASFCVVEHLPPST